MGEEMAESIDNKVEKRKAKNKDRVDGSKDSVDSTEGRKDTKKKRHKEGKKNGVGGMETVVEQRDSEDCGDVCVGNGREERPKKHKKGKMELVDGDDMVKSVADDEHKHSEERNRAGREGKGDGKLVVKEKNVDYVLDSVREGIVGSGDENGQDESKKKKKKRKRGNVSDDVGESMKSDKDGSRSKRKKKRESENVSDVVEEEVRADGEWDKRKKEKKKKMDSEDASDGMEDKMEADEKRDKSKTKGKKIENAPTGIVDETGRDEEGDKGEKKKKAKKGNVSAGVEVRLASDEEVDKVMKKKMKRKNEHVSIDRGDTVHIKDVDKHNEDKKKKANAEEQVLDRKDVKGKARIENDIESDTCDTPTPKRKSRKVSFSDEVEVFDDGQSGRKIQKESNQEEGLVQGKRFSKEEDKLVEEAVLKYIEEHNLGDDGLHMVLNCRSYREIRNCWKEIVKALPWRPAQSIYYRAHVLFERSEKRIWTEEEKAYVRKFYEEHGPDWRKLATHLDKHRFHCKDLWRRIRLMTLNKGHWKQEEYQKLFDLVNKDLSMRAFEERKFKHGMIRDNICWEAISTTLATRHNSSCCEKWYSKLTSSMVREGLWADTDDYRLLDALTNLDAASLDEVDWDCLIEHREGHVCRKRWNQMVKHIGEYAKLSFSEQVEVLAKRYNPDYLEAREAFDSQPILP